MLVDFGNLVVHFSIDFFHSGAYIIGDICDHLADISNLTRNLIRNLLIGILYLARHLCIGFLNPFTDVVLRICKLMFHLQILIIHVCRLRIDPIFHRSHLLVHISHLLVDESDPVVYTVLNIRHFFVHILHFPTELPDGRGHLSDVVVDIVDACRNTIFH